MPDSYQELLDAAIAHLKSLQSRGVRHIQLSPESIRTLNRASVSSPKPGPAPQSAPKATPTTPRPPSSAIPPAAHPVETAFSARPVSVATSRSAADKAAAFESLRKRVLACVKCEHLVAARSNVVFGVGNPDADLMFVGEAPGADEDLQGEPFVGKAGQLLTKILQTMGLKRSDVYIANILKCRPDTPGQPFGNRKPTSEEMQTCIPFLHEQIDLVQPKILVALGGTAVEGLLGKTAGITRLRGNWQTYRGIPLMPTYHPAFLLRQQNLAEKRKLWEDMLQVMERLGMPITEKHRNYFLSALGG